MAEIPDDSKLTQLSNIGVQPVKEIDWRNLLKQIMKGTCVPFIGPHLCVDVKGYPHKRLIAQKWADEEQYPFEDRSDLARVAQFLAVQGGSSYAEDKLKDEYQDLKLPNSDDKDEPHRVLAQLPLPLYITTSYDNFIASALKNLTISRDVRREYCRWQQRPDENPKLDDPIPSRPLVFHLFGHADEPGSLVLTEHDYLKFLVNISREQLLLPSLIRGRISAGSLLFIGYEFNDWDFRVLLHTIASCKSSVRNAHISVVTPDKHQEAAMYLRLYFNNLDLRVFLGTCHEFVAELRRRWEAFENVRST